MNIIERNYKMENTIPGVSNNNITNIQLRQLTTALKYLTYGIRETGEPTETNLYVGYTGSSLCKIRHHFLMELWMQEYFKNRLKLPIVNYKVDDKNIPPALILELVAALYNVLYTYYTDMNTYPAVAPAGASPFHNSYMIYNKRDMRLYSIHDSTYSDFVITAGEVRDFENRSGKMETHPTNGLVHDMLIVYLNRNRNTYKRMFDYEFEMLKLIKKL